MNTYTALQIGDYHTNYCEDYLFTGTIGSDKLLCAVMDGCTNGTDCYFISTLVGKLLRKIAKEKSYRELYEPAQSEDIEDSLKSVLKDLFSELKQLKNQLMLEPNELLTTLILLLYDQKSDEGLVIVIGDGLVSINGQATEFDQENKPDYIGFHLAKDFETWYQQQEQKIRFRELKDVSIATDGIFMFSEVIKTEGNGNIDPVDFLLNNRAQEENPEMLSLKLKTLERQFGLKPTDDLALIRIIR
jgi:serine/threonine protein phosphatase PrpC